MANHKSSEKRAKQTVKKNTRNKLQKSILKTVQKKVLAAIAAGKKDEATTLLKTLQSAASKLASKGIIKKENAARKTSRLTSQVNKLK